jgi:methylmalonyl-CoA mutase cobalamin-binding subunit
MVSSAARSTGWNVAFLGASLPASEIASATLQKEARAVALSIVYPSDDGGLGEELVLLRRLLGPGISIIVGGRAAQAYGEALERIKAVVIREMGDLYSTLDQLRATPRLSRA